MADVHEDEIDLFFREFFEGEVSSPSKSEEPWHRKRWRETASDAQRHVLDLLRRAGSTGLSTLDLIEAAGPSAQARVGELIDLGWQVETRHGGSVAVYVLTSTEQGTPPPKRAPRVSAGRWVRLADGRLLVEPMQPRKGPDDGTWDAEQVEADVAAVEWLLRCAAEGSVAG